MTSEIGLKLATSVFVSICIACFYHSVMADEIGFKKENTERQRYRPFCFVMMLPVFLNLVTVFLVSAVLSITNEYAWIKFSVFLSVFFHISLYYCVLLLFMPLLRKIIIASGCALLWLIPNFLYFTEVILRTDAQPLFILSIRGEWVWIVLIVWLVGFAACLIWNIVDHFRFRRYILKDAAPVEDEAALGLLAEELDFARMNVPKLRLVVSENVSSPLTIGLMRWSMVIVLPDKRYDGDELRLIFRHELIHIAREDSWNKFFLMFCTAICWFNPLMWTAMRKSSEDLELSCDETVLLKAKEDTRRRYASLLLSSAGEGRGFTSCLSAAKSTMRYRLKAVVHPRERRIGTVLIAAVFFVLSITCGSTAFALGELTAAEVLDFSWAEDAPDNYMYFNESEKMYEIADEAAFDEYLGRLKVQHYTGGYDSSEETHLALIYIVRSEVEVMIFSEKFLEYRDDSYVSHVYYLPDGFDYDYIKGISRKS